MKERKELYKKIRKEVQFSKEGLDKRSIPELSVLYEIIMRNKDIVKGGD